MKLWTGCKTRCHSHCMTVSVTVKTRCHSHCMTVSVTVKAAK